MCALLLPVTADKLYYNVIPVVECSLLVNVIPLNIRNSETRLHLTILQPCRKAKNHISSLDKKAFDLHKSKGLTIIKSLIREKPLCGYAVGFTFSSLTVSDQGVHSGFKWRLTLLI